MLAARRLRPGTVPSVVTVVFETTNAPGSRPAPGCRPGGVNIGDEGAGECYPPCMNNEPAHLIGPHEGCELALMLSGEKKLAVFHDVIPPNGLIAEEIIPEAAFAPYVAAGRILCRSEDLPSRKLGQTVRYVCFALPEEAWRIDAFLFITRDVLTGRRPSDDADDITIGRLLGYSEDAIQAFLDYRAKRNNAS